ncbi:MAG: 2-isopropylmalate synthase, partial [Betaproteobacteria bacterium]|nr:2-isopropylmalate synthase [Betaproteobacteria bacterium]
MALKTRRDYFDLTLGIDTTQIVPSSKLVSGITGFPVQPNKAVVGANAFAHASGIHQDGVLKARDTYEIMRAEDVGWTTNRIVLGKLSGRNAFKQRLQELGIEMESDQAVNAAFMRFKELADRKAEILDEDIQALVSDQAMQMATHDCYRLLSLEQSSKTGGRPHGQVVMTVDGREVSSEAEGNGPVDAVFKAIESEIGSGAELLLYSVNAITTGTESQGEVTVRLSRGGRIVNGVGADPDIIVASAKAYIGALNKLQDKHERLNPQA